MVYWGFEYLMVLCGACLSSYELIYDFEKMGKGVIWIKIKAKTIPINFSKVSFKLEFVKIFIASLPVYYFRWFFWKI